MIKNLSSYDLNIEYYISRIDTTSTFNYTESKIENIIKKLEDDSNISFNEYLPLLYPYQFY